MHEALKEAYKALVEKEMPVGAIIVSQGVIIARAHNQVEKLNDPLAHAEILAISAATEYINSKYLSDCIMYVTLEPCIMCASALKWAKIGGIVYGAKNNKEGFGNYNIPLLHPKTKLTKGILEKESITLLDDFFNNIRI